jgi:hypothetical protein
MAEKLNPEAANPSEIEPKSNITTLNETGDIATLNDWFNDQKHIEDNVGNVADDHAIWVYFGVGGPA